MISRQEEYVFNFLKEVVNSMYEENITSLNFNVYRGYLPNSKVDFATQTKEEQGDDKYFPFFLLRVLDYEHLRSGIDTYNTRCDFELAIGMKIEDPQEYLDVVRVSEFVCEKLMSNSTIKNKFNADQTKPFKMQWFKDQAKPYMYCVCSFTTTGNVAISKINTSGVYGFDEFPVKL